MIPNLFWKAKIPDELPKSIQIIVAQLKKTKNKRECLKKAYAIITKRFEGCHTYQNIYYLFVTDLDKLWKQKLLHCTNLNYLLRVLLIKSERFEEKDIKIRIIFGWFYIHQYLKIKTTKVDPWGRSHGIKFGDFAKEFD
tara:strand:- start:365 stop:781 length:417 start_codon:yes stop_codon:yes gene_type:complete